MKRNIYLILLSVLVFSCQTPNAVQIDDSEWSGTISASDERNAIMNSFTDAYENKDTDAALAIFAEDAVFHVNDAELTPQDVVNAFMTGHEYYDDIKNLDRATATFNFDEGSIYTCTWFDWQGTSKSTGAVVGNPVHAWFKWDGDKVSEVTYIFDSAEYVANMSQME